MILLLTVCKNQMNGKFVVGGKSKVVQGEEAKKTYHPVMSIYGFMSMLERGGRGGGEGYVSGP